jgi:hypothetical protein
MSHSVKHRRARLQMIVVFVLCALLTACELEETITITEDGSGTYIARISVDKQFAEVVPDVKTRAQQRGFRIIEESETADRKLVVLQREFANIAEISDDTDAYTLFVARPSKFKRAYSLRIASRASAASNGFQKRIIRITLPVTLTSASAGTMSGRSIEWDATHGGVSEVQATGVVLPFGLTPAILALLVLLALGATGSFLHRARKAVPVCPACGASTVAAARFCAGCGANVQRPLRVPRAAVLGVIATAVGAYVVITTDWRAFATKFRREKPNASTTVQASAAGTAMAAAPTPPEADAVASGSRATSAVSPEETGPWIVFERWLKSPNAEMWGEGVELWAMRPDGSERHRLTSGYRDEDASWSPDGKLLIFTRRAGDLSGVYVIAPDGTNLRRLSASPGKYPKWTRDNKLLFAVSKPEGWRLATSALDGQNEQLLDVGEGFTPVPSPDGKWIAFHGANNGVYLLFTADGRTSQIGGLRGYPQSWLDEQHLAVQTDDNRCIKTDLDALAPETILNVSECNISFAPSAPNRAVFQYDNSIWRSDDNLETRHLLAKPDDDSLYHKPIWSPQ